jgi:integrase
LNFTRASVGNLPAAKIRPRDTYKDSAESGLQLHVSRHGLKTFFLYRKHEKQPLRIKLGRFPDISVSQARNLAQQQKAKLVLGQFENKDFASTESPHEMNLVNIVDNYFSTKQLKPKTLSFYRDCLKHLEDWKNKPIHWITKEKVIERHNSIAKKSGDGMADGAMRTLRALFEFYKDRYDYTGDNPVKTLSANRLWKTGKKNRRTRHINKADLPKWIAVFDKLEYETWRDYLMFVLVTGLRKNEAAMLECANVSLKDKSFYIPDTKNNDPLRLPINSIAFSILSKRVMNADSRWVFPAVRDPRRPLFADAIWRNIELNHQMKLSTHDLRRTFATLAESLDLNQITIKRLVNHRSIGDVTEGYIIPNVDRLREPSEKIAQLILQVIENQRLQNITSTEYEI